MSTRQPGCNGDQREQGNAPATGEALSATLFLLLARALGVVGRAIGVVAATRIGRGRRGKGLCITAVVVLCHAVPLS